MCFGATEGVTDWNNALGWESGLVPQNVRVFIKGENVVCEIKEAIPTVQSITVSEGATLKISCAIDLPPLIVHANSTVLFESGADAKLNEVSFSPSGKTELPVFEVAEGGKVSVPGGTVFHNVKVHLYGALSTHGNGDLVIGGSSHATGSSAWYGFVCEGATIKVENGAFRLHWRTNNNLDHPWLYDEKKIKIKNTAFDLADRQEMSFGMNGGNWNPCYGEIFDNTIIASDCSIYFGLSNPDNGNRSHQFVNGSGIGIADGVPSATSKMTIGFGNQVVVLDGPNSFINVDSLVYDGSGWGGQKKKIVVRNTSRFRVRAVSGTGAGINQGAFVFGDGIYEIGAAKEGETAPFASCENHGVLIEKGGVCRIRAIDDTGTPADRAVTLAAVPISGPGSLAIENNMGGEFGFAVTVTSANNTATGTASADDASRLLFANGANWAGKVVSKGNVGFAGDEPATVAMAALSMESGTFPVRVFALEDGTIASDRVDIGDGGIEFAEGTGFSFEIPGGLRSVPVGSRLVVASAPVGSEVPHVRIEGFSHIKAEVDSENPERVLFVAKRTSSAMQVIVR